MYTVIRFFQTVKQKSFTKWRRHIALFFYIKLWDQDNPFSPTFAVIWENISAILLAHTVTIWICTRLQRVIAAENSTACEYHESTRRAGAKNVIPLPENVNRMMGLWIRFTPTVFTSPLLTISVLETFFWKPRI